MLKSGFEKIQLQSMTFVVQHCHSESMTSGQLSSIGVKLSWEIPT